MVDRIKTEIERMRKINRIALESKHITEDVYHGRNQAQNHILSFIESIPVEEPKVDLEKEIDRFMESVNNEATIDETAKYFYDLGSCHAAAIYDNIKFD